MNSTTVPIGDAEPTIFSMVSKLYVNLQCAYEPLNSETRVLKAIITYSHPGLTLLNINNQDSDATQSYIFS